MKATTVLVALLLGTYAGAGVAASLTVMIEKLNAAAAACGISEAQLHNMAVRTLESSPLQPDANAGGVLNVRVTVTKPNPCSARISVQIKAIEKPSPSTGVADPMRRPRAPSVMLCDKSGDYSAPKTDFSIEVESVAQNFIKRCLGSLKY
jgi:hypothetical protein